MFYHYIIMNYTQIISLLIAIIWGVGMNIAMKYSTHLQPFAMYAVAYAVAVIICVVLSLVYSQDITWWTMSSRLTVAWLGVSFVVLNIWFLWLYSSGLSVSYIPIAVTAWQTIVLTLMAWRFFWETFSWHTLVGIVLILCWLIMLSIK